MPYQLCVPSAFFEVVPSWLLVMTWYPVVGDTDTHLFCGEADNFDGKTAVNGSVDGLVRFSVKAVPQFLHGPCFAGSGLLEQGFSGSAQFLSVILRNGSIQSGAPRFSAGRIVVAGLCSTFSHSKRFTTY